MSRRLHLIIYLFGIVFFFILVPGVNAQHEGSLKEVKAMPLLEEASAYPNPFKEKITIEYQLQRNGRVEIQVNNILGQKIRSLIKEDQQPGLNRVHWDGKDGSGSQVRTGMYYIILRTATDKTVIKVMKTK